MVRHPSVVHPSVVVHNAQTSSSTKGLGQSKPVCGASLVGGTKDCLLHQGHKTKMAVTAIFGETPLKILFSRTGGWGYFQETMYVSCHS